MNSTAIKPHFSSHIEEVRDIRILIIEDEEAFSDIFLTCLEGLPVEAQVVKRLASASAEIEGFKPEIIFLDNNLPDGKGTEWLEASRGMLKEKGIDIFGVSSGLDVKLEFLKAGALDYLQKPVDPEEVVLKTEERIRFIRQREANLKKISMEQDQSRLKDELMSLAAHDFRSPVSAVLSIVDILKEDQDAIPMDEALEMIEDSARYIMDLSDSTLEMFKANCRVGSGKEPIDLLDLVQDALVFFNSLAKKKNIELFLSLPSDSGEFFHIFGPTFQVKQVIHNLLSNALKYSFKNSSVWISVFSREGKMCLEVTDEGVGIPENLRGRLFEPFGKLGISPTAGESSTGLGLYLVHQMLTRMGATIEYQPNEKRGSVFTVVFS